MTKGALCALRTCKLFQTKCNMLLFLICWRAFYYFFFLHFIQFVLCFVFSLSKVVLEHHTLFITHYVLFSSYMEFERVQVWVGDDACVSNVEMHERIQWTKECQCKLMHTHIQNSCHSAQRLWIQVHGRRVVWCISLHQRQKQNETHIHALISIS